MTRKGKIARLPRSIRDTLNRRLDNGEQSKDLVDWLNSLDEVKKLLSKDFEGRPISEQNLSEWKQGGFLEWRCQEVTSQRVRTLLERSENFDGAFDRQSVRDRLADLLAVELAAETQRLLDETTDPAQRWQYLCQSLGKLKDLRQGDLTALHAAIEREHWEIESERREQERQEQAITQARAEAVAPVLAAMKRPSMVAAFGGGEKGEKLADLLDEIDRKFPHGKAPMPGPGKPASADQTKIKAGQAKSK